MNLSYTQAQLTAQLYTSLVICHNKRTTNMLKTDRLHVSYRFI